MRRKVLFAVFLGVFLFSCTAWADFYVVATAPKLGTKITSLPYTITEPGFYYLERNLITNGNGIVVLNHAVTIDLAGFVIIGPGAYTGIDIGSYSNVEIRNGTVTNFQTGINTGGMGSRIINMRFVMNNSGFNSSGTALFLVKCTAISNANGFIVTNSANILENQAFDNSAYGFLLGFKSTQLVDKNVSAGNGTNWFGLTGCTTGLNTP